MHKLFVFTLDNFIDMETVKTYGDHISQTLNPLVWTAVDIEARALSFFDLDEYQI